MVLPTNIPKELLQQTQRDDGDHVVVDVDTEETVEDEVRSVEEAVATVDIGAKDRFVAEDAVQSEAEVLGMDGITVETNGLRRTMNIPNLILHMSPPHENKSSLQHSNPRWLETSTSLHYNRNRQ